MLRLPDRLSCLARREATGRRLGLSFVLVLFILVNLFGQANKSHSPGGEKGNEHLKNTNLKCPIPAPLNQPTEEVI